MNYVDARDRVVGPEDVAAALEKLGLRGTSPSVAEDQHPSDQSSLRAGDSQATADDSSSSDTDCDRPYRCQRVPRYLYRVTHPGSHSITENNGTMRARAWDKFPHFSSLSIFKGSLERHFQWTLRSPSPFMSTFSSLDRTRNWSRMLSRNNPNSGKANIHFYMIDTKHLGTATVFDAERLAADFDIVVKYGAEEKLVDYTAEYLIKGSINANATMTLSLQCLPLHDENL